MDSVEMAAAAAQRALLFSLEISVPILAVGLVVGLFMSVLQAVTQIQEQMLSFIPKVVAMAAALLVLTPWLLSVMADYVRSVLGSLGLIAYS